VCFHVNVWDGEKIKTVIGEEEDAEIADDDIFWVDQRSDDANCCGPRPLSQDDVFRCSGSWVPTPMRAGTAEPGPRGGGIIRYDWWQDWDDEFAKECGKQNASDRRIGDHIPAGARSAFTEKEENDPSALSIWGYSATKNDNPKMILLYCWSGGTVFNAACFPGRRGLQKYKIGPAHHREQGGSHSVGQELAAGIRDARFWH